MVGDSLFTRLDPNSNAPTKLPRLPHTDAVIGSLALLFRT